MSELIARFPSASAVRAVRFPTTDRAVRSLGGPGLPFAFAVVADAAHLSFIGWRKPIVLWELAVSRIESISVAETESGPLYRQVALAIVLSIQTGSGSKDLPIVPVSDDGKSSLTWRDAEVRALARRLSDAMRIAPGAG